MAYSSVKGRKPIERASKIAHAQIINDPRVMAFLGECSIPEPADEGFVRSAQVPVDAPNESPIRIVVAVDGGYTETPVRERYPSATFTFFTFGPLMFRLSDLRVLDSQPFIAPEDIAKLKRLQRFSLALPTKNISRNGESLRMSVRRSLDDFLAEKSEGADSLNDSLRWLLFRQWNSATVDHWVLPRCPNTGCSAVDIELDAVAAIQSCGTCAGPLFLADALRLHERVDEEQGATGILGYLITSLEQIVLVHLIRTLWRVKPRALREVAFIKDGPLAFFGTTAPLSSRFRQLVTELVDEQGALLNVVGLEKSGAFVDHAVQIEESLQPGHALILTNDYIRKYVVPGDPASPDEYGKNTYWGGKLIYKAPDGNVYVATVPILDAQRPTDADSFANLRWILQVVSGLRCSMYENALLPIALVNKLVSLSDFPSARILETFARASLHESA